MVIFTTAFSEYAVEGFNLCAIDYLLKPIEYQRFLQATRKAVDYYDYINANIKDKSKCIFVRSDYKLVKIQINDIKYIESLDDYIKIYTTDKKPVSTLMSLKGVMDLLPPNDFMRVHRSFIVPLNKVESVRNKRIQLPDIEIVIGNSYSNDFMKWFNSSH